METSLSASDAAAQDYAKAPWHDMPKAPLSPGGLASYSDSPPLLWHELPMLKLDAIDRKILAALQDNGRLSNVELAERVGLSPSPCLRRVRQLEDRKGTRLHSSH